MLLTPQRSPSSSSSLTQYSSPSDELTSFQSSENDDECAACGGNGYLLCCDGCNRAFHFSCLDPPRHEDDPIFEEPWYCSKCETLRVAPPKPPRGLFAGLISHIEKCNTRSFALPVDIRSFYEGVRTGERGEFENVPQHKPVE